MKWATVLKSLTQNDVLECPCCKSKNIDYCAKRIKDDYGYLVIWCTDCKKACHISRLAITDNLIKDTEQPKDLDFSEK